MRRSGAVETASTLCSSASRLLRDASPSPQGTPEAREARERRGPLVPPTRPPPRRKIQWHQVVLADDLDPCSRDLQPYLDNAIETEWQTKYR